MERNLKFTPGLVTLLLVVLVLVLYYPTLVFLMNVWLSESNPNYSHGPLLLLVVIWMFYSKFRSLHIKVLQYNVGGAVLLLPVSLIWFIAYLVDVQLVQYLSLLLMIAVLLVSVLGWQTAFKFFIPVGLMITAIPMWEFLHIYLRYITTVSVTWMLNMTGISSIKEGFFILIPAGTFSVDESCSGLRQFIVAIALATIFSYINKSAVKQSLLFILAAISVAIVTNIIRVFTVVVAGQLTNMTHPLVDHHGYLGWTVFGIGMFIYFYIADKFIQNESVAEPGESETVKQDIAVNEHSKKDLMVVLFVVFSLAIGPVLANIYTGSSTIPGHLKLELPEKMGVWLKKAHAADEWSPKFQSGDIVRKAVYEKDAGDNITFYLSYFAKQKQGKEAVNGLNHVFDRKKWQFASKGNVEVIMGDKNIKVEETIISSKVKKSRIVWKWYFVNGNETANDLTAKIYNAWGMIKGDNAISVLMLSTAIYSSPEKARLRLRQFVKENDLKIKKLISYVQDQLADIK